LELSDREENALESEKPKNGQVMMLSNRLKYYGTFNCKAV